MSAVEDHFKGEPSVRLIHGDATDVDEVKKLSVDGYMFFAGNMRLQPTWKNVVRNWSHLTSMNKPVLFAGTANAPYGNRFDSQVMSAESYFTQGLQVKQNPGMREVSLRTAYGTNPHAFPPGQDFPYNHGFNFAYVWRPQRGRRFQG